MFFWSTAKLAKISSTQKFLVLQYTLVLTNTLLHSFRTTSRSGMPTGSPKKKGSTFCGKLDGELPLPVRSFKGPPILSEIISSDLDESHVSIFWCKKSGFLPFGGRLASLQDTKQGWRLHRPICRFTVKLGGKHK